MLQPWQCCSWGQAAGLAYVLCVRHSHFQMSSLWFSTAEHICQAGGTAGKHSWERGRKTGQAEWGRKKVWETAKRDLKSVDEEKEVLHGWADTPCGPWNKHDRADIGKPTAEHRVRWKEEWRETFTSPVQAPRTLVIHWRRGERYLARSWAWEQGGKVFSVCVHDYSFFCFPLPQSVIKYLFYLSIN